MDINAVAHDFAALCIAGKFDEAGEKYWSPEIVSIEAFSPDGSDTAARGIEAVRGKGEWWYASHDIHSAEAFGPYINGDQFIVRFKMDVTFKETGARMLMDEDGLYTVKDGKIVEERFFYSM
jgi:ketosteroid isomerase-like protein